MKARFIFSLAVIVMLIFLSAGASPALATPNTADGGYTYPPAGYFNLMMADTPGNGATNHYTGGSPSVFYNAPIDEYLMSYYAMDGTHGYLKLAYKVTPGGGDCGQGLNLTCQVVDGDGASGRSSDNVGLNSSLDIKGTLLNTVIGISYYDATTGAVKYAENSCLTINNKIICSWSYVVIQTAALGQSYGSKGTSLKFDNSGVPYIAYSYVNANNEKLDGLFLAHRLPNSTGNCGSSHWQCDLIQGGDISHNFNMGYYPSMDLHGATIHIAYYDNLNNILRYATNTGSGCTLAGWMCVPIDLVGGKWPSLKVGSDGKPQIAYYDKVSGKLGYAYFGGVSPNCGLYSDFNKHWTCIDIDTIGTTIDLKGFSQVGISLALDSLDLPAIAYMKVESDVSPAVLDIARPNSAYGTISGNCGPKSGILFQWTCTDVHRSGNQYLDEGGAASIALRPNGMAIIAYQETDSYYNIGSLRLAYQDLHKVNLPFVMP